MKSKEIILLLLLTSGALFIHGYHPFAEDAEIYVPGILKILHPQLFPFGAELFQSHAHLTLFPNLIAASVRVTHLPLQLVLFVWQVLSIFLLLLACWELTGRCFTDVKARWAGVALIAALLTLPVAGTGLYILDQYLNPRNLTAFAAIFAIVKVLDKKYVQAVLFLVFAAALHPLMAVFALSYCVLLVLLEKFGPSFAALAALLPFGITFEPPGPAYHQVALSHSYFYLTRWAWYEWVGAVAPIAILWWFSRVARYRRWRNLELLCRALVIYQILYTAAGLVLSIPARFESLARLQPMRSLYLLYILLILFGGGLVGEHVLKNRVWRWLALFVPLCAGMFVAQRALFPASAHIEWPGASPRNRWAQAFVWIRENTPSSAIFALDPTHMDIPGEDENGFRAISQRSMLADEVKDSGAVTMFPPLAETWLQQIEAQRGWRKFQLKDFQRLQATYGVSWVVLQAPGVAGLECPYRNEAVLVCRLN
ncbi:MAG: hypothetical protein LAN63_09935 [Acidobacteriia bacterium]|nr:hypothetical protein [Terriglobia bacterium]